MENLTLLKIGGNVIDNLLLLDRVLQDFAKWEGPKTLVHGGGKLASDLMKKMGIMPKMVNGRRITDRDTLDIVTMVYAGLINKNIIASLQKYTCNAIGLSGADANIIPAQKRPVRDVDYGYVGDIDTKDIDGEQLSRFIGSGLTPVMAPITHDGQGSLLNTNADTIASGVAIALAGYYKVCLVFCFEKKGVLRDPSDEDSVIDFLDEKLFDQYKDEGIITAGMIPKLENAFAALHNGVDEIRICSPEGVSSGQTGGTRIRIGNK
ncbi:MAG: acetylglutamate kinase [Bacteroidales bacterium]|nr:acetylglutamate kinase [Bacteroidales bacterium]